MKIYNLTSRDLRESGMILIKSINMKTVQNILIDFNKSSGRFLFRSIDFISNGINTVSNGATVIVQEVDRSTYTTASLSTAMTGTNNDVTLTAQTAGADGNSITLALVDPSGNDQELSVAVAGTDIVVSLATNGSGTITTTAAQLIAAIEGDADAAALVAIDNKGADDGTGVVTALTETALAGGLDWTLKDTLVNSTDLADSDKEGLVQALSLVSDREVIEGTNSLLISVTTGATATADLKDLIAHYDLIPNWS